MKSLQNTIFLFFVVLLLAVQAVFLQIIFDAIRDQENMRVDYQLSTANAVFDTYFDNRNYYLAAFAETAALDFGLKQVFREDNRSLLVALNNHRQRIDADIALAIEPTNEIIAELVDFRNSQGRREIRVGAEQGQAFRYPQWLEVPESLHLYPLNNRIYQLRLAPLKNGALIIGWVGFGYSIDEAIAEEIAAATGLNVGFILVGEAQETLVTSSHGRQGLTQNHAGEMVRSLAVGEAPAGIIATQKWLGEVNGGRLAAVMYGHRSDLLSELRRSWWQLGLIAGLILCLSLAGAYLISARISRPVRVLVEQTRKIAGGNYDLTVDIKGKDELAELAEEFNHMQQAVVAREKLITHRAYHDDLTDLPNRNRLVVLLNERTQGTEKRFILVKLAISRLGDINSSLGHQIGDEVIKEAAGRLRRMTPPDALFHIGGGEFIVIVDSAEGEIWQSQGQRLLTTVEHDFEYEGITLLIEAHLGIAQYPDDDTQVSGLLQKASMALQEAQRQLLQLVAYESALGNENLFRMQLINDLKAAIETDQLVLHYQPKLRFSDGAITQVEALVRWSHPHHGMIPPDRFIPLAEQTGLISSLTRWVIATAVRQYTAWREKGVPLAIAVNISAENLKEGNFYQQVMDTLSSFNVPHGALSLEITESALAEDIEIAVSLLERFMADGVQASIDDYGTGYSSLAQLRRLPVTQLKIDKSFVYRLINSTSDQIIVRSTIELGHNLGLEIVAEGIEDPETFSWLQENGCDTGQGYYICRPRSADEIRQWLEIRRPPSLSHKTGNA